MIIGILQGDKVKLTCQFRGREMEFQDIAREMFEVRLLRHTSVMRLPAPALLRGGPLPVLMTPSHWFCLLRSQYQDLEAITSCTVPMPLQAVQAVYNSDYPMYTMRFLVRCSVS